jgi:hypothetical protein
MDLKTALAAPQPELTAIAAYLDGLESAARVAEVVALPARAQARLFEAAAGFRPVTLESLVPSGTPAMTGVPHEGLNSLWAFRRFAKVFYRPDDASAAGELWGYNRTGWVVKTFVGPGYYVAYPDRPGEVLIDYTRQPARPPPGGPRILSNAARISFVVYNQTQDVLRGVTEQVSIGRAARRGRVLDNWFVLCRSG